MVDHGSVAYLVDAWHGAAISFADLADELSDADFARPSGLPGWTVGDVVAHVSALESELGGAKLPDHSPDWDALPHATDLFSRYTEVGVDYRRGWEPDEVRAELRGAIAERAEQLRRGPQDPEARVPGVAGIERSLSRVLRMRVYDICIHEIDVRDALNLAPVSPGAGLDVTTGLALDALPYVFVKRAGARPGDVLHVDVRPGFDRWVKVGDDGRAAMTGPDEPIAELSLDQLNFIRLASGRAGDPDAVTVIVDRDGLAAKVIAGLNTAP